MRKNEPSVASEFENVSSRRAMLKRSAQVAGMLAALGMLPPCALAQAGWNKVAFEAKSLNDVMKALGGAKPIESKDVILQAPDIEENGAQVPIAASTRLPGVKRLLLLVEKNPNTLSALFELTDAVEPSIAIRLKMEQSSRVYAVVMMGDGRVLYAHKDVSVTLGGCGE
jgi:sulfur-oxidizing protein SoxY